MQIQDQVAIPDPIIDPIVGVDQRDIELQQLKEFKAKQRVIKEIDMIGLG